MTPAEAATNTVSEGTTTNANRGAREYTVTGLDDTKTYTIAVFPAEYVTNTDGVISFRDTEGTTVTTDDNNVADWAMTAADIETVNNTVSGDDGGVEKAVPVSGVLKFTIDSTTVGQVIPVVFLDADNGSVDDDTTPANNVVDLDLNADNTPSEAFGLGGQKNWLPLRQPRRPRRTPAVSRVWTRPTTRSVSTPTRPPRWATTTPTEWTSSTSTTPTIRSRSAVCRRPSTSSRRR